MIPARRGRRLAAATLVSCIAILACWSFVERERIVVAYHRGKLKRNQDYFFETLEAPRGGLRGQALEEYLRTAHGRQALFRAFATETLDRWVEIQADWESRSSWVYRQPDGQPSLKDFSCALLWIGPQTAGLRALGEENVIIHVLLKRSPADDGPAVGSGGYPFERNRLPRGKAILAAVEVLRGHRFSHPRAPGFQFEFLAGNQAVEASGLHSWREAPPDSGQTVCFASRSDPPER